MAIVEDSYCCYCGNPFRLLRKRTTEHLVPLSKGGTNNDINKRYCCSNCNNERGNRPLNNWLVELEVIASQLDKGLRFDIDVKIENIKYIREYILEMDAKLFRTHWHFQQYSGQV